MGIWGLKSFLWNKYRHYFQLKRLPGEKIVVDGQSVIFLLLHDLLDFEDYSYGGDYDKVANCFTTFMDKLKECRIEAVFVFDGINSMEDRKWEKVRKRNADKLRNFSNTERRDKFPSLLAIDVALSILRKADVTILQADQEADGCVVAVARELNCSVMTSDSDILFYDVPGVWYLDASDVSDNMTIFQPINEPHALKWCLKDFLRDQVLTIHDMALFMASITCFRDQRDFGSILESIKSAHLNESEVERVEHIFCQLKDKTKMKESCDAVSFHAMVNSFMDMDSSSKYRYITSANANLRTHGNKLLPNRFQQLWRRREFPPYLASVLCTRKVNLPFIVEDIDRSSAFDCSRQIRGVSYGVLIQYDGQNDTECVVEYCRRGHTYQDVTVKPIFTLPNYGRVPSLEEIPEMSQDERKAFFLAALGTPPEVVDNLKFLPDDLKLYISVLRYWVKNCEVMTCHIRAAIFGIIKTRLMNPVFEENDRDLVVRFNCTTPCLNEIKDQLDEMLQSSRVSAPQVNLSLLHPVSELQALLFNAIQLHQLALSPFGEIPIELYFCGSFLFFMVNQLRGGLNVELLLRGELGDGLLDFFVSTEKIIQSIM